MAVHYKYKSENGTFCRTVAVAAPSISVGDLKRLIMQTGRYGRGRTRGRSPRESIAISNEQTREEYADDNALVLQNSMVVVRRVAGPPADTILPRPSDAPLCPRSRQVSGASSSNSAPRSAGTEGDEAKAISAVIDDAEPKWEGSYDHRGAAHNGRAPPAGYVCHRCRVPGHFIQHCPTNGDCRFDFGRPPVLAPEPAEERNDDGFPTDLHCRICKEVMADAVVASKCCFNSFCDRCIRAHIVVNSKCACGAKASADDLIPNPTLRTTISNMLAARASSAPPGTEKQKNEVAASTHQTQSPAASQKSSSSSSHVHTSSKKCAASESEHSDGSKSTSAPSTHEAKKKQQTTDTAASHVIHQQGYNVPFAPACYDPFFCGMPWSADPSMYHGHAGMPYAFGGGYPMGSHPVNAMAGNLTVPPAPRDNGGAYGYHGRKRTRADCEDQSFKRRCGGGRSQASLVLT